MQLLVTVTASDIARGKPRSACNCPVALALNRAMPYGARVAVAGTGFAVLAVPEGVLPGSPANVTVKLPYEEAGRIDTFDSAGRMAPHEFTVEIPDVVKGEAK